MKPQSVHPCTAALASILSANPQSVHPCTAALASILSAKCLQLPALLIMAFAVASCGRAPVSTRPALPALERPTFALPAAPGQLRIPHAALVERGGIPGVFVLDAADAKPGSYQARFRMVRPGHAEGDRLIILAGLRGNETLVLGDLRSVRDGTPISNAETADKRR